MELVIEGQEMAGKSHLEPYLITLRTGPYRTEGLVEKERRSEGEEGLARLAVRMLCVSSKKSRSSCAKCS